MKNEWMCSRSLYQKLNKAEHTWLSGVKSAKSYRYVDRHLNRMTGGWKKRLPTGSIFLCICVSNLRYDGKDLQLTTGHRSSIISWSLQLHHPFKLHKMSIIQEIVVISRSYDHTILILRKFFILGIAEIFVVDPGVLKSIYIDNKRVAGPWKREIEVAWKIGIGE